jgi:hypothetical protein
MTDKNRETKILAIGPCPTCGAAIRRPCRVVAGRPMVCRARKAAWQATHEQRPVDYLYARDGAIGMLVAPQSAEALDHLRSMALATRHGWAWVGGALRVPHADMPTLTRRLIDAGWRTGDRI